MLERHAKLLLRAAEDRVVQSLRECPQDARVVPDDWPLPDAWEDYKYNMQREEFLDFDVLADLVELTCQGITMEMDDGDKVIVWLGDGGIDEWWSGSSFPEDDPDPIPLGCTVDEFVAGRLLNNIKFRAEDEALLVDPDEARNEARAKEEWEADERQRNGE